MASRAARSRPTVSVLAYDGMSAFETGIVTEVFGLTWPDIDQGWYQLRICAEAPGTVSMVGGATLSTPYGLAELAAADTVIVPSVSDTEAAPTHELVEALRLAHQRGARMVSICSGAFALCAAGLLDDRRATTHWRYADLLQRRYPRVEVDPNPLYIDEHDVLTSAGCAAGLDLCLHIVRKDFGANIASAIARRLVIPPHRDGGQAQFIEAPMPPNPEENQIARTMTWAVEHIREPITVQTLALKASMSKRSYLRHFSQHTGTTPIRWLINQRVQASLRLLETTNASIDQVATTVGFDTPVTYRHHFTKAMRTSPSAYRRTFRNSDDPSRTR